MARGDTHRARLGSARRQAMPLNSTSETGKPGRVLSRAVAKSSWLNGGLFGTPLGGQGCDGGDRFKFVNSEQGTKTSVILEILKVNLVRMQQSGELAVIFLAAFLQPWVSSGVADLQDSLTVQPD